MAVVRNIAGEARDIPVAGRTVEDGEAFEVPDDVFDSLNFSPDLFKVIEYPISSKSVKKAATKVKE